MEMIRVAEQAALAEAEAATYEAAAVAVAHGIITQEEVNAIKPLDQFVATYGGIDGITNLNGRTLIFTNTVPDAETGGWVRTSLFDPLEAGPANNGLPGSFDSIPYSETIDIPLSQRYDIWQINYVTL